MNKQSTITRAEAQGQEHRRQTRKQRRNRKINQQSPVSETQIEVSRTHHLFIGGKSTMATIGLLRRARLRHYITAFLKGGMNVAVFINPFSLLERNNWNEVKSIISQT